MHNLLYTEFLINYIMHVLVTGISGFIGNELAKELLNQDFEVTAILRKTMPDNNVKLST